MPSRAWRFSLLALAFTQAGAGTAEDKGRAPLFYRGYDYGSESQFNPASSFINWSFDAIQVPKSFDTEDLRNRREEVWENLRHPNRAIDRAGGTREFINREILPYKLNTKEWVPNYALHLFGGGMVYRKNVEWFQENGYAYPVLYAATLAMAAEFVQEVVEKKSTEPADEVADFYLFRPAGMLLFSHEPFARFAAGTLRLAEWPYQPMIHLETGKLANVGENFIVRPALLGPEAPRPFVFFGMTTLLGASHALTASDSISWGVGAAVERAKPLETRASAGLFYDRNNSLLASLLVNGTEELAVRLNLHPGVIGGREWWSPGVFVGMGRKGEAVVGLTLRVLPFGASAR